MNSSGCCGVCCGCGGVGGVCGGCDCRDVGFLNFCLFYCVISYICAKNGGGGIFLSYVIFN